MNELKECQCNCNENPCSCDSRDPEYLELQNKYLRNSEDERKIRNKTNRIEQARSNLYALLGFVGINVASEMVIESIEKNIKIMDEVEKL